MADPTLTDLAAEYRAKARDEHRQVVLNAHDVDRAHQHQSRQADWAALADLVESAARRHPQAGSGWADRALATAAHRLAAHLEAPHA